MGETGHEGLDTDELEVIKLLKQMIGPESGKIKPDGGDGRIWPENGEGP